MAEAYVAAGSNVRPRASLRRALALLRDEFPGLRASPAYANKAVGFEGDDFVNLVAAFATDRPLPEVLATLKAIERALGRVPGAPKWGPRTLDLDLLLYGDLIGRFDGATLPHRDLATRAWVLGPLAALEPGLRDPVTGERIGELWARFDRGAHPLVEISLEGAD
ncbi:MAG TPA: 2-amino-4-hydroxy-6-hydroxymethyldihydropteridine diphosphokinase [Steroidobacteraceae bacterium]|nr:2-amino-4-hydroxy-6-hydroxymethyldihydropteridine diphosphokinase [Steroidobacteraceae bacterium]